MWKFLKHAVIRFTGESCFLLPQKSHIERKSKIKNSSTSKIINHRRETLASTTSTSNYTHWNYLLYGKSFSTLFTLWTREVNHHTHHYQRSTCSKTPQNPLMTFNRHISNIKKEYSNQKQRPEFHLR